MFHKFRNTTPLSLQRFTRLFVLNALSWNLFSASILGRISEMMFLDFTLYLFIISLYFDTFNVVGSNVDNEKTIFVSIARNIVV